MAKTRKKKAAIRVRVRPEILEPLDTKFSGYGELADPETGGLPPHIAQRVEALRSLHGGRVTDEVREYIYSVIFQLRLRGVTFSEIARLLNVGESKVYVLAQGMREWVKTTHTAIDPDQAYAEMLGELREMSAEVWKTVKPGADAKTVTRAAVALGKLMDRTERLYARARMFEAMDIRGGGEQNPRDKSADDVVSTLEAIFEPDIKLLEGPDDSAY